MDKSATKTFVQHCKMTRPDLCHIIATPSVKVKRLIYTPNAEDPFYIVSADEDIQTAPPKDTSPNNQLFFKDPLGQIGEVKQDENGEKEPRKLGHNMRASVGHSTRKHHMTQADLRHARQDLLEKMRQQRANYSKHELAQEDATVLVNQLLSHGFKISPPSDSLRFECATPMTTDSADYKCDNVESDLVRSVHNELERVHRYGQPAQ